jgi:hypothetical protein
MEIESEKMQAGLDLAYAIGNATSSVLVALQGEAFQTLLTNTGLRLSNSILSHNNSLNYEAGLYIRPFYRDGLNLAVVDLKTGKRADIVLSPAIEPLRLIGINTIKLPAFSFDQTGTKLIVKGTGLHGSRNETYEMLSPGCGASIRNWTIPFPSILSYDIPAILRAAKQTRGTVAQDRAISEKERAMITAAFNGDQEMVKRMLEQGANANAIDEDGHTALMHATLALKADIVELLLKSGANASIRDDDCWDADRYFYLATLSGTAASQLTLSRIGRLLVNARKEGEK